MVKRLSIVFVEDKTGALAWRLSQQKVLQYHMYHHIPEREKRGAHLLCFVVQTTTLSTPVELLWQGWNRWQLYT